jgi:hypothetical protein
VIEVKTFWLHQKPMQTHDLDLVTDCQFTDALALGGRDLGHGIRQREGCDLDALKPRAGCVSECVFEFPTLIDLVADGKFHRREIRSLRPRLQVSISDRVQADRSSRHGDVHSTIVALQVCGCGLVCDDEQRAGGELI